MQAVARLLEIMAKLRDPEGGCPWDRKQTYATIVPHTIEEAYEVADSIERGDFLELKQELGDLLLQVVFYAQMAKEDGLFDFEQVAEAINDKLVRRHPHVFAGAKLETEEERHAVWEAEKARERRDKEPNKAHHGVLDGIARALPALLRAEKLQKRAAKVGFDWTSVEGVIDKIHEELEEVKEEVAGRDNHERLVDEIGDLIFAVVNLARHVEVDPEEALRHTNNKFESRFRSIELALAEQGKTPQESTLEEMDRLWDEAKGGEGLASNTRRR